MSLERKDVCYVCHALLYAAQSEVPEVGRLCSVLLDTLPCIPTYVQYTFFIHLHMYPFGLDSQRCSTMQYLSFG